ncbi:MAG: hypothetical protein P1V51_10470 [Deltaproteobacteria bacterium]|nr:hypothetical protein [Deltaproteobacteria bacterium]
MRKSLARSALFLACLLAASGCSKSTEVLETELETALTLGNGGAARAAADLLLERKPNDPDVLADRGRALELIGSIDAAIESYSKAMALAPGRADLALLRGAANLRSGKVKDAIPDLRIASQADPQNGYAAGLHAVALYKTRTAAGQVEAEKIAAAWLEKDPRNIGALVAMAFIAHARGQRTVARELTARAREVAPQEPLVSELTAQVGL